VILSKLVLLQDKSNCFDEHGLFVGPLLAVWCKSKRYDCDCSSLLFKSPLFHSVFFSKACFMRLLSSLFELLFFSFFFFFFLFSLGGRPSTLSFLIFKPNISLFFQTIVHEINQILCESLKLV
jgi:hypothetical protein